MAKCKKDLIKCSILVICCGWNSVKKDRINIFGPKISVEITNSADICLFKVNHRKTRKRCEISSKLMIKTPERRH